MDKNLLKGIVAMAGIILVSVSLARGCANSETVADYAASREAVVTPDIEKIEENSNVTGVSSNEQGDTMESTEIITTSDAPKPAYEAGETEISKAEDIDDIGDEEVSVEESAADASFYIEEISEELLASMRGKSYADNIDETIVNSSMLRHLVIKYYDFDNEVRDGEIVCNEKIADDLLDIFKKLYEAGYQLERVRLIDEYDADDDASMDANNTSCFNYRVVDNTTKLSYHAYGLAIDVNPFYNPYVQMRNGEEYVCPSGSVPYARRDDNFPYKIDENDLAYKLFKEHGFIWGGDWNSCKDYQHFEKRFN